MYDENMNYTRCVLTLRTLEQVKEDGYKTSKKFRFEIQKKEIFRKEMMNSAMT